jgi:2-polyprenyl-6-methoxyphenol hydroxylase-like FAD-dependent oxidoreductase
MSEEKPIVIAGGGIGGLAVARMLALSGRKSVVLEKADQFGEIGAGIQLGPNTHRAFETLQVKKAMHDIAWFPKDMIMMDSLTGEEILRMPSGHSLTPFFGDPYAVIHRADLHAVLFDVCSQMDEIELRTSSEVSAFNEISDGVLVSMANGDEIECSALIGADGLWSNIRPAIIDDGDPVVSGHIAYRAVLPIDEVPEELGQWIDDVVLWGGPRNHLVHYRLRRGELFNIVAVFHSQRYVEGWDEFGDPKELYSHFDGVQRPVKALLDKIDVWKMWVLCDRVPVKEWSKGRVTLLGDAAHPTLQYLAAGAGMAMEDAICLAKLLDQTDGDIPKAFSDYPKQRYLRTARVQLTARLYGDLYHAEGVARELRNQLLGGKKEPGSNPYGGMAWLYQKDSEQPGGI